MDPIQVVEEVIDAFRSWDVERALELFDDNAVFQNMPTEPVQGKAAVRRFLAETGTPSDVAHDVRNIIAQGNLVMAERVEQFTLNGRRIRLPVVTVAEVENGRVTAWRDYFDMATFVGTTPAASMAD
jgi:limonene-1,2-epoxide hydrolase